MAIGYESAAINDQLVNVAPGQAYSPLTFGQAYTGPGFWPRNGVYNVPPVTPSPGTWEGSAVGGSTQGGNLGPPMPSAGASSSTGGINFFHPTKSPLVMAAIFLIAGLLMLQFIHYR